VVEKDKHSMQDRTTEPGSTEGKSFRGQRGKELNIVSRGNEQGVLRESEKYAGIIFMVSTWEGLATEEWKKDQS